MKNFQSAFLRALRQEGLADDAGSQKIIALLCV